MKTKSGFWLGSAVALMTALAGPASAATSELFIDGVPAGTVLGWDGGDVRVGASAATATAKLAAVGAYAPLAVRVAYPPSPDVAVWVNDLAAGKARQGTVVVADADATGRLVEAYELSGAALVDVEFPEFNAARTTLAEMRLIFAGTSGRAVSPPAAIGALSKPTSAAGFQLSMLGVDGTGVSRIGPIRVVQSGNFAPAASVVANVKTVAAAPTLNVVITVSRTRVASWQSWLADSVKQASGSKRDGAIALLDANMKASVVALNLFGCSLVRLSRPPDSAGVPSYYLAELACERVELGGLRPPAANPTLAKQASTAAASSEPTVRAAPANGPIATVEADRGTRDPVQFPRVSGLTRIGYSGSFQKTQTNESARYSAQEKINDLVTRVEAAAIAAGWELSGLTESGTGAGRQVSQSWLKKGGNAELTFVDVQDGAATQMHLTVVAQRAAQGGDLK